MDKIFINDFESLIPILITTPVLYGIIILYIRLFGKRTTSQMNSFDWIVTVALGSLVATTVINEDVPVLSGALAILCLMLLQYLLTKTMINSKNFKNLIRSSPCLLVFKGEFLEENMEKERVVKEEVNSALRENGLSTISEAYAVVLETDAKFSVIKNTKFNDPFSLSDVKGLPDEVKKELHPSKILNES